MATYRFINRAKSKYAVCFWRLLFLLPKKTLGEEVKPCNKHYSHKLFPLLSAILLLVPFSVSQTHIILIKHYCNYLRPTPESGCVDRSLKKLNGCYKDNATTGRNVPIVVFFRWLTVHLIKKKKKLYFEVCRTTNEWMSG